MSPLVTYYSPTSVAPSISASSASPCISCISCAYRHSNFVARKTLARPASGLFLLACHGLFNIGCYLEHVITTLSGLALEQCDLNEKMQPKTNFWLSTGPNAAFLKQHRRLAECPSFRCSHWTFVSSHPHDLHNPACFAFWPGVLMHSKDPSRTLVTSPRVNILNGMQSITHTHCITKALKV